MTNEDLIIELIKGLKTDIQDLKTDMNRRFEQVDKRFEQVDRRFEQIDKQFDDLKYEFREMKEIQKEEIKRVDEIYRDRKNIKVSWSLPFVGFNAGVAAFTAFIVSSWK